MRCDVHILIFAKRSQESVSKIDRIPANNYIKCDVRFRGKITGVRVEIRRHTDNVPCAALPIIRQIDEVLVVVECERDLIAVEGPRTKLHNARLLIEGEVCDVDRARALIDRWRHPEHFTIRVYQHITFVSNLVVAVGAVNKLSIPIRYKHNCRKNFDSIISIKNSTLIAETIFHLFFYVQLRLIKIILK